MRQLNSHLVGSSVIENDYSQLDPGDFTDGSEIATPGSEEQSVIVHGASMSLRRVDDQLASDLRVNLPRGLAIFETGSAHVIFDFDPPIRACALSITAAISGNNERQFRATVIAIAEDGTTLGQRAKTLRGNHLPDGPPIQTLGLACDADESDIAKLILFADRIPGQPDVGGLALGFMSTQPAGATRTIGAGGGNQ